MVGASRALLTGVVGCCAAVAGLSGCYEQLEPAPAGQQATTSQQGPLNQHVSQGGGSSLGAAKRTAENTVQNAQEAQRRAIRDVDPSLVDDEPPPPPE